MIFEFAVVPASTAGQLELVLIHTETFRSGCKIVSYEIRDLNTIQSKLSLEIDELQQFCERKPI